MKNDVLEKRKLFYTTLIFTGRSPFIYLSSGIWGRERREKTRFYLFEGDPSFLTFSHLICVGHHTPEDLRTKS